MPDLDEALKQAQPPIRDALAQAERELEELTARRAALEALIARAKAALGERSQPAEGRRTLHQALELILNENGNTWMTVSTLAKAVNERGLYVKRDGSPVEINQVHARTHNYEDKFEKDPADRSRVRLRQPVQ